MNLYILVIFGAVFVLDQTSSYVVMKKDDEINARKQFNNYKRFEVRKRADDDENKKSNIDDIMRQTPDSMMFQNIDDKPADNKIQGIDKKEMESVVIAIDTGAKNGASTPKLPPGKVDVINKLEDVIKTIVRSANVGNGPLMRARQEYDLKPELVQLRRGQQSIKYEVNSDSLVKAFGKLLSSNIVRRYADDIGQKAAAVFRVINDELYKKKEVLPYNFH